MDSYTAALRQVAEQHKGTLAPAPSWLKSANTAAGGQTGGDGATLEEKLAGSRDPAPRPPPKSSLRSRPSFTQLEQVVEEAASEQSSTNSPVPSTSARSAASEAESIQTAIYNPPGDELANTTSTSGKSRNDSGSRGSRMSATEIAPRYSPSKDASYTPATSLTGSDSALGFGFGREESPKHALHSFKKQLRSAGRAKDQEVTRQPHPYKSRESPMMWSGNVIEQSVAARQKRAELETAPAPLVPRDTESGGQSNQGKHTSHLKSAAHAIATKLKPGHSDDEPRTKHIPDQPMHQYEPMTEAIDGMIGGLEPPQDGLKISYQDGNHYNYGTEDRSGPPRSSVSHQHPKANRLPPPKTYETRGDGVPILMRKKSGVWVEAVEGAELTSTQDQQQNVPKDQPIAEREAEDIPEITIPDDPWNNLPPYIKLEYGTAGASSPTHRPDTRSRREEATASWAQDQADMRSQTGSRHSTRREPTLDARRPKEITPWEHQQSPVPRPRRRTIESQAKGAPFYYEEGRIHPNDSHPSNIPSGGLAAGSSNSRSHSHKPSVSDSSLNTSLNMKNSDSPPPRNPRRNAPTAQPSLDIQERIAQSASAVEQIIYGLPPPGGRAGNSRFEDIELV